MAQIFYVLDVLPVTQPTVKALKETQSTDLNQPHLFFIHCQHSEAGKGHCILYTSSLFRQATDIFLKIKQNTYQTVCQPVCEATMDVEDSQTEHGPLTSEPSHSH